MRITYFALTRCRRPRDIWKRQVILSIVAEVDLHYVCLAIACATDENHHVLLLKYRT